MKRVFLNKAKANSVDVLEILEGSRLKHVVTKMRSWLNAILYDGMLDVEHEMLDRWKQANRESYNYGRVEVAKYVTALKKFYTKLK